MSARRALLVAFGLLIAAAGIALAVRGFRGAGTAAPKAGGESSGAPAAGPGDRAARGEKREPRWAAFVRPGGRQAPPRPLARFARGLADPFDRPAGAAPRGGGRPEKLDPGLRLEGISAGAQPVALLSGRAVREGDTVSGYRVARIGPSSVTLVGPRGSSFGLKLGGGR